jgi:hypothetical protein
MRRTGLAVLALTATIAAGCGGSGHKSDSKQPSASAGTGARTPKSSDVDVIRGWVDTLRAGHVDAAARYFAVPAIVQNDSPLIKLTTPAQVRAFNAALPCGAKLKRTFAYGRYVAAVFVLTNRPGGGCGSGAGQQAATAFVIRKGKIVEWRRVPLPSEQQPSPSPGPAPRQPLRQSSS